MRKLQSLFLILLIFCKSDFSFAVAAKNLAPPAKATSSVLIASDLIAKSQPSEWRDLDNENLLYIELTSGRVVIELAPEFAPRHVANVKELAREKYWDGLAIVRVQDNYVVQWADPNAEKPELRRKLQKAKLTLAPEFDRELDQKQSFKKLPDKDIYAPETGFVNGFPVGRDLKAKKSWLIHCYGTVGVGRDDAVDSGGGTELYAVIGHSPRHLDRNITLIGRVVKGIDLFSSLPRGKGPMGFFEKPEQNIQIRSIKMAADVPENERLKLETLRTDSQLFDQLIQARRNRKESWFHFQAGKVEICNLPVTVREKVVSMK